eukprot:517964_1
MDSKEDTQINYNVEISDDEDYKHIPQEFSLTWKHIIESMQHQLYPTLSKSLNDVVSTLKIKLNDFTDETIKNVLAKIGEEKNLSEEHIVFMDVLIRKACSFDPITQACLDDIENDTQNHNGIVHWLGTNKNSTQWENPAKISNIKMYRNSALEKYSEPLNSIVNKECFYFCTVNKIDSWVMIDLLDVKIKPTHYELRHCNGSTENCLRNWYLEASNNSSDISNYSSGYGGNWIRLSTHTNDTSLRKSRDRHKWEISQDIVADQMFSQFRIFQFNKNSSRTHRLSIGHFEIYGVARDGIFMKQNFKPKYTTGITSFVYKADNDTNGLLYALGKMRDVYIHPIMTEQVSVSSSPLDTHSKNMSTFVGREDENCYTESTPNSFMALKLKTIEIKLKKYTLRNNSNNINILRNWNLEGSNDGKDWHIIKQHKND